MRQFGTLALGAALALGDPPPPHVSITSEP